MKTKMKRLAALVLASAVVLTSFVPSQAAMPLPAPVIKAPSDVTNVDYRRPPRYYRGYRGSLHRRPGYRYHNGYWFPLAAFAAGAIIGGAIATPTAPRAAGINPKHYQWCANRYRSYDAYSNTFQPYHGPRQRCYSPYY
ncbi:MULTISPECIES: BA14K family protein [Alphaproteobacteria]|uniref:Lectin-like protein BA14k n=2 Tax=Alphaproteobacteria TaxID=28211 RepID=A0A512HF57_9HYPH|nr:MULTISPECIES: BA14K family protein [Alphaproteobacteria]GEO84094.1 hypothetical protein RNA01_10260 [Ciceribacter naphthalenivorans]GLR24630.1 hypothetical protein GCM10007920_44240 [Ciceribacter naphthalenivorans]GLT07486.1 hypothetical protein GCM10007926_44240 [Sphingomonas psychrolutea]